LPEAEQELIGGYHTEYAGIRLLMYLVAEFLHMITASFLIVILFLGGWHLWGVTGHETDIGWGIAILRVLVLMAKVFGVIVFFMMVRWSWPRFRFDQLMALSWKVMLPLGLVNLVMVAVVAEFFWDDLREGSWLARLALVAAIWGLSVVAWIVAGLTSPLATDNRPRLTSDASF
jgi:NADH-quinone oxidoreductase subunit H